MMYKTFYAFLLAVFCAGSQIGHAKTAPTVQEQSLRCITSNDVVGYMLCNYFTLTESKVLLNGLKQFYFGIVDEKHLDKHLQKQNYIEVLNILWTEDDLDKKIKWLESRLDTNHVILFVELARSYWQNDPTIETYMNRVFPLASAIQSRAMLDTFCTSDSSVREAAVGLYVCAYAEASKEGRAKYGDDYFEEQFYANYDRYMEEHCAWIERLTEGFITEEQAKTQPSPEWLFTYKGNLADRLRKMYLPEQLPKMRSKFAHIIRDGVKAQKQSYQKDPIAYVNAIRKK